jgi:transcriptional regulator with XRE-family HTH domain
VRPKNSLPVPVTVSSGERTVIGLMVKELFGASHGQVRLDWLELKMAASIGEKLRLEREAHGIALRDISEQTRISMRYLEAIETDDYRRLPGGIFNRSFIRAYAKFIGFNEQEAIEEYTRTLREHGEPEEDDSPKPFKSMVYTDDGGSNRSPLKTLLLAIIILAVLSLCVWAGLRLYNGSLAPRTGQRTAPGELLTCLSIRIPFVKEGAHGFTV